MSTLATSASAISEPLSESSHTHRYNSIYSSAPRAPPHVSTSIISAPDQTPPTTGGVEPVDGLGPGPAGDETTSMRKSCYSLSRMDSFTLSALSPPGLPTHRSPRLIYTDFIYTSIPMVCVRSTSHTNVDGSKEQPS